MEKNIQNQFILDNRTGRIPGCDVRFEKNEFVFTLSNDPDRPFLITDVPSIASDVFLQFVSLIDDDYGNSSALNEKDIAQRLISFAKTYGPLFGFAGINPENPAEIREPLADWYTAFLMMSRILKVVAFTSEDKALPEDFDNYFRLLVSIFPDKLEYAYIFNSFRKCSSLYRTCLKEDMFVGFTTKDHSVLSYIWDGTGSLDNAPISSPDKTMFAASIEGFPLQFFPDVRFNFLLALINNTNQLVIPLSKVHEIDDHHPDPGSLLKIVADRHLGGLQLGYQNYYDDCQTEEEGAYGIVSNCLLSFLWHQLAQDYTHNQFRVCENEKCSKVFSINVKTNSGKLFCSEMCRSQANNNKLSRQCSIARKAFYACKSFTEIYEETFEKPYSHGDPERKKLEERLARWIAEDFSLTKKGQAALKQGAGRIN